MSDADTAVVIDPSIPAIIDDWFLDADTGRRDLPQPARWFRGGKALDAHLRSRWSSDLGAALAGERDHWREERSGSLAFVVLLDQFARNLHRGSAAAFAGDERALAAARTAIARGDDRRLPLVQRVFLYLPLEHHESIEMQRESLRLFTALRLGAPDPLTDFAQATLDSAREHAAIIERFGRYPHRNAVLGRTSSDEEREWLDEGGGRFGQ